MRTEFVAQCRSKSISVHCHVFLFPFSSLRLEQHLPPAVSSMPIGENFPFFHYWGFPKMHDRCPACGLHFNREPGYFLGAMYVSYGLGLAFIFVLGAALWALTGWRLDKIAIWAVLLFLPFAPMLTFFSRVLWIYLDQKIDPEPL